jgi:hypothetical protein
MKKIDLGQSISILANLGVLVGVVFLVIELRQNSDLLGMEIRSSAQNRIAGVTDLLIENPHILELLRRDPGDLTPTEYDTLVLLGIRSLSNFESAYGDVRQGLVDEAEFVRRLKAIWNRPNLNYAMPLAWPTFRQRGSPEFVEWMERNVVPPE